MHEYVYADRILQSVLGSIGAGRPKEVDVEVGGLLGLTKESLTTAYEVLSKGTKAEGTKLKVKFTDGSVECPRCGYAGSMRASRHEHRVDPVFACPECGSSLRVKDGLEVRLIEVR